MRIVLATDRRSKGKITIAVLFGTLLLIQLINRILQCGSYNPNIEGIESTFVYYIQRALNGEIYYQSPVVTPFFLHQYPPIYTFIVSFLLHNLGVQATEVHHIYTGSRVINLLANLGTVSVFWLILRRHLKTSKFQSYIWCGLLFLSFFAHNYAVRADSLKTFFVISTLFFTIRGYYAKDGTRFFNIILAALFISIAVFTKQDAFIFTGIIPLSFWVIKERKLAIQFFIASGLFVFIGFAIMWSIYGFHYWENVVLGLKQGANWAYFVHRLPLSIPVICAFLLVLILLCRTFPNLKSDRLAPFFILSSVCSFCIASVSLLKWGSSPVYYMDFFILLFLLAAILARHLSYFTKLILFGGLLFFLVGDYIYNFNVTRALYSFERESVYKDRFENKQIIAKQVTEGLSAAGILCLDKDLTNHLYPYGLFPTFEAEFPLYISCDREVFKSIPAQIFTYSSVEICKETKKLIMNEKCLELPGFLSLDCLHLSGSKKLGDMIIYDNQ